PSFDFGIKLSGTKEIERMNFQFGYGAKLSYQEGFVPYVGIGRESRGKEFMSELQFPHFWSPKDAQLTFALSGGNLELSSNGMVEASLWRGPVKPYVGVNQYVAVDQWVVKP